MKQLLAVIIGLALLAGTVGTLAEGTLEDAAGAVKSAPTLEEQLALLHELSIAHAAELKKGGWDVDLDIKPAGEFPEAFIPNVEDAEVANGLPDGLRDAKFIAIRDAFEKDGCSGGRCISGGFYVRLPEDNRAQSLEVADAVLYLTQGYSKRGDYIGEAYDRVYRLYAAPLDGSAVYEIGSARTEPPYSGLGVLAGERLSSQELWRRFEAAIYNVPLVVEYPEGTATFRITGDGCCMTGLEGEFTRFEVPREVEGRPVVGIEKIKRSSLEELILPEGLEWISGRNAIECQSLKRIQFPSTLKRITGEDVFWYGPWPGHPLDTLEFNEGLEEIGEDSLIGSQCIRSITLPSTLRKAGAGFLKNGLGCSWVALPDGMTALPGQFLSTPSSVVCVFLPASITSFAYNALNRGSIYVYTPEGSPASQWADEEGFTWFPCDSAEDMPKPAIEREGDFEYLVLNDEAMLLKYHGTQEEVAVPGTLGGAPVHTIKSRAFVRLAETNFADSVRVLRLPDTVRLIEPFCANDLKNLEALYVPPSVEECLGKIVKDCPNCTVWSPADSPAHEVCESWDIPWAEWDPGQE